jgi:hypothetical protein
LGLRLRMKGRRIGVGLLRLWVFEDSDWRRLDCCMERTIGVGCVSMFIFMGWRLHRSWFFV